MKTLDFNFSYETQENDRLYILWDDVRDEDGQMVYPEDEQIQEFIDSLDEDFEDFYQMESDGGVASHFNYDNCIIYGNE